MTTVTVREHGLPMSGPLIAPTMNGRKRQTRRLHGLQRINETPDDWTFDRWQDGYRDGRRRAVFIRSDGEPVGIVCPYGQPGDRLWVRETWHCPKQLGGSYHREKLIFAADADFPSRNYSGVRWSPSIFMPRWASRITLELTDVRVERVQDISEDDAIAEGIVVGGLDIEGHTRYRAAEHTAFVDDAWRFAARAAFSDLWDAINAKRGYPWQSNSWVFALSFRLVQP